MLDLQNFLLHLRFVFASLCFVVFGVPGRSGLWVGCVLDCLHGLLLLLHVFFSFFAFAIAPADWTQVVWSGAIPREQGGRRKLVVVEVDVGLANVGDFKCKEILRFGWIQLEVLAVEFVEFVELDAPNSLDDGSCFDAALAGEPDAFGFHFGADDDHVLFLGQDVV